MFYDIWLLVGLQVHLDDLVIWLLVKSVGFSFEVKCNVQVVGLLLTYWLINVQQ